MEPHLLFALGGAYVPNWVWKDTAHVIFPWGITNPNDYTPANPLWPYRNESYFLRHFQPEFQFPKTLVILPQAEIERDEASYVPLPAQRSKHAFQRRGTVRDDRRYGPRPHPRWTPPADLSRPGSGAGAWRS